MLQWRHKTTQWIGWQFIFSVFKYSVHLFFHMQKEEAYFSVSFSYRICKYFNNVQLSFAFNISYFYQPFAENDDMRLLNFALS